MGILDFLRKKDPIEQSWEQERRIAYKSALQEARMKNARVLAERKARREIEIPTPNRGQGFLQSMNQAFGSGSAFTRQKIQRISKKKKQKIINEPVYISEEPGLRFLCMDWKEWKGKRIFVQLNSGAVYSGKVIDIDSNLFPIIFISIIDKYGKRVTFPHKDIRKIVEEKKDERN